MEEVHLLLFPVVTFEQGRRCIIVPTTILTEATQIEWQDLYIELTFHSFLLQTMDPKKTDCSENTHKAGK